MDKLYEDERFREFKKNMVDKFPLKLYASLSDLEDQKEYWEIFDYLEDHYQLTNSDVMEAIGFKKYSRVDPFSLYRLFINFDFSIKSEEYGLFGLSKDALIYYMIVGRDKSEACWSSIKLSDDQKKSLINNMIENKKWFMEDNHGNKYKLYSNFYSNDSNCLLDSEASFILLISSPSPCGNRIVHLNPIKSGELHNALIKNHFHEISERSFELANLLLEKYSNHCLGIQNTMTYQLSGIFGQIIQGSKMVNPVDTLNYLGLNQIMDTSIFDGLLQRYSEACDEYDVAQLAEKHIYLSTLIKETIDFQMMCQFVRDYY